MTRANLLLKFALASRECRRKYLFVVVLTILPASHSAADEPFNLWESSIRSFEERDRKQPPQPGGVLFLGSSSIRLWDTAKAFPKEATINRGFGGSQIADSIHFADRIAIPYKPRMIVFYAGDNDIAVGKSAEQVLVDYKEFVGKIHAQLPETRIAFVAIKPSPFRWKLFERQQKANRLVENYSNADKRLAYIDVVTPMLDADGQPRGEFFQKDKLHLNEEGYKVWREVVGPFLKEERQ
jgi:lysophospholipase L1-like esterase